MAPDPLTGFLTKTQAARKFNRHKSTITRGINAALRAQDEKVLDLCKVKTADGKIHDGNTVAPVILSQLHNDGLRPVWYLLPEAMDLMIKRDSSPHGNSDEDFSDMTEHSREKGARRGVSQADPASPNYVAELEKQLAVTQERLSIIEQQNIQLLDDKDYFKEQAKVVTQLQKEDNVVRGQTNELIKELLDRLRASDQIALTDSHPSPSKHIAVVNQQPITEGEVVTQSESKTPPPSPTKKKQPTSIGKQRPKKRKATSTSKAAKDQRTNKKKPTAADKYLPTISRFFTRSK